MFFRPIVEIAHDILKDAVSDGDTVVDCTAGKGNDTLYLAGLVGESGKVYSFDIQKEALLIAKEELQKQSLFKQVVQINDSHAKIKNYITTPAKAVIFNLGYLPGGDKNITTQKDTTLQAIKDSLSLLANRGILIVVAYRGHSEGMQEYAAIKNYFTDLGAPYNTSMVEMLNKRFSPVLFIAEKVTKNGTNRI